MELAKQYSNNWEKLDQIGKGGQGTTFKAVAKAEKSILGALKILNRQQDKERRARMHRETVNLQTLDHSRIPKVLDSNSQLFENDGANLYIVTEYIIGGTLSENIASKPDLLEQMSTVLEIVKVVEYSHKRGIVHRDLKPDNIILRNSRWDDPIVIDFGISFNSLVQDDDNLTPSYQHLGNRFLILPEQKVGESGKRDFRSDITSCVGLLFYLVTDVEPTILLDENNNKPHQRDKAKEIIGKLPKGLRDKINSLFDLGFNYHIDKRIQSCESLLFFLGELMQQSTGEEQPTGDLYEKIKLGIHSQNYLDLKNAQEIFSESNRQISSVVVDTVNKLGQTEFQSIQSGHVVDLRELFFSTQYGIRNAIRPEVISFPILKGFLTGSELVIIAKENEKTSELFRYPISGKINWGIFKQTLSNYYLTNIASKL